jgi:hypothetical protein
MCVGETNITHAPINWEKVRDVLDEWTASVAFSFHFCEAAKAISVELRDATTRHVERAACLQSVMGIESTASRGVIAHETTYEDVNRLLVNDLSVRLDDTIAEAKAKFREARFMRNFMWYLIHCFDAMINGTYSDDIHG